jgi:hypothetical protein
MKKKSRLKKKGGFYALGNCLIPACVSGASPPQQVQFPSANFGSKAAEPL